jgi:hypothetical protein
MLRIAEIQSSKIQKSIAAASTLTNPFFYNYFLVVDLMPFDGNLFNSSSVSQNCVREKNVQEKFSLYGIPLFPKMSAHDSGFVQVGLRRVGCGEICVVVYGLHGRLPRNHRSWQGTG